eukprot:Rmarinus@m.14377
MGQDGQPEDVDPSLYEKTREVTETTSDDEFVGEKKRKQSPPPPLPCPVSDARDAVLRQLHYVVKTQQDLLLYARNARESQRPKPPTSARMGNVPLARSPYVQVSGRAVTTSPRVPPLSTSMLWNSERPDASSRRGRPQSARTCSACTGDKNESARPTSARTSVTPSTLGLQPLQKFDEVPVISRSHPRHVMEFGPLHDDVRCRREKVDEVVGKIQKRWEETSAHTTVLGTLESAAMTMMMDYDIDLMDSVGGYWGNPEAAIRVPLGESWRTARQAKDASASAGAKPSSPEGVAPEAIDPPVFEGAYGVLLQPREIGPDRIDKDASKEAKWAKFVRDRAAHRHLPARALRILEEAGDNMKHVNQLQAQVHNHGNGSSTLHTRSKGRGRGRGPAAPAAPAAPETLTDPKAISQSRLMAEMMGYGDLNMDGGSEDVLSEAKRWVQEDARMQVVEVLKASSTRLRRQFITTVGDSVTEEEYAAIISLSIRCAMDVVAMVELDSGRIVSQVLSYTIGVLYYSLSNYLRCRRPFNSTKAAGSSNDAEPQIAPRPAPNPQASNVNNVHCSGNGSHGELNSPELDHLNDGIAGAGVGGESERLEASQDHGLSVSQQNTEADMAHVIEPNGNASVEISASQESLSPPPSSPPSRNSRALKPILPCQSNVSDDVDGFRSVGVRSQPSLSSHPLASDLSAAALTSESSLHVLDSLASHADPEPLPPTSLVFPDASGALTLAGSDVEHNDLDRAGAVGAQLSELTESNVSPKQKHTRPSRHRPHRVGWSDIRARLRLLEYNLELQQQETSKWKKRYEELEKEMELEKERSRRRLIELQSEQRSFFRNGVSQDGKFNDADVKASPRELIEEPIRTITSSVRIVRGKKYVDRSVGPCDPIITDALVDPTCYRIPAVVLTHSGSASHAPRPPEAFVNASPRDTATNNDIRKTYYGGRQERCISAKDSLEAGTCVAGALLRVHQALQHVHVRDVLPLVHRSSVASQLKASRIRLPQNSPSDSPRTTPSTEGPSFGHVPPFPPRPHPHPSTHTQGCTPRPGSRTHESPPRSARATPAATEDPEYGESAYAAMSSKHQHTTGSHTVRPAHSVDSHMHRPSTAPHTGRRGRPPALLKRALSNPLARQGGPRTPRSVHSIGSHAPVSPQPSSVGDGDEFPQRPQELIVPGAEVGRLKDVAQAHDVVGKILAVLKPGVRALPVPARLLKNALTVADVLLELGRILSGVFVRVDHVKLDVGPLLLALSRNPSVGGRNLPPPLCHVCVSRCSSSSAEGRMSPLPYAPVPAPLCNCDLQRSLNVRLPPPVLEALRSLTPECWYGVGGELSESEMDAVIASIYRTKAKWNAECDSVAAPRLSLSELTVSFFLQRESLPTLAALALHKFTVSVIRWRDRSSRAAWFSGLLGMQSGYAPAEEITFEDLDVGKPRILSFKGLTQYGQCVLDSSAVDIYIELFDGFIREAEDVEGQLYVQLGSAIQCAERVTAVFFEQRDSSNANLATRLSSEDLHDLTPEEHLPATDKRAADLCALSQSSAIAALHHASVHHTGKGAAFVSVDHALSVIMCYCYLGSFLHRRAAALPRAVLRVWRGRSQGAEQLAGQAVVRSVEDVHKALETLHPGLTPMQSMAIFRDMLANTSRPDIAHDPDGIQTSPSYGMVLDSFLLTDTISLQGVAVALAKHAVLLGTVKPLLGA